MPQKKPVDLIQRRFPGQLLISVHDFAKIVGEMDSGTRKKIGEGKREVQIGRRGERNFLVPDVLRYLNGIWGVWPLPPALAIIAMAMEAPAYPSHSNACPVKNHSVTAHLANGARRTSQQINDLALGRGKDFLEMVDAST